MFDKIQDDERVYRRLTPPRPVTVELGRALDLARRALPADRIPLWLKARGLRWEATMPAELLAWVRLSDGNFLGCCRLSVTNMRGCEPLEMTVWLTQDAIRPAPSPGDESMRAVPFVGPLA